jgi:hypothetical protein
VIIAGTTGVDWTLYLPAGSVDLLARSVDFLDSNVLGVDAPDGGTADVAAPLGAGTGCSGAGTAPLAVAGLVVALAARAPRRTRRCSR